MYKLLIDEDERYPNFTIVGKSKSKKRKIPEISENTYGFILDAIDRYDLAQDMLRAISDKESGDLKSIIRTAELRYGLKLRS